MCFFPIRYRNIRYTAPERILGSKDNILGDIWSLGIIIAELIFDTSLWPSLNLAQFTRKTLSLVNTKNVLEKIARECNLMEKYNELNPTFRGLLESCLRISPKERPYPYQILEHELFQENIEHYQYKKPEPNESLLLQCPLKQVYYWLVLKKKFLFHEKIILYKNFLFMSCFRWQLAGGDVHSELKAVGLIRNEAPILSMPK